MDRTHILKIVVGDETLNFDLAKELQIDRDDIDFELGRQASLYAWFAVIYERARSHRVRLDAEVEELAYALSVAEREKHGGKKKPPTEAAIKAVVRSDEAYRDLCRRAQIAEESERLLNVLRDSFYMRKDTLVQLARSRGGEGSSPTAAEVERIKSNLGLRRTS